MCPFTYNLPFVLCQRLSVMSSSGPSSRSGQTGKQGEPGTHALSLLDGPWVTAVTKNA